MKIEAAIRGLLEINPDISLVQLSRILNRFNYNTIKTYYYRQKKRDTHNN
jgi:hypothetical protein